MIELALEQGTRAWSQARLGIPTASQYHRILSPTKLAPSAQANRYLCEKLGERVFSIPMESEGAGPMVRGTAMEQSAAAFYEFQNDTTTRRSGFFLTDDKRTGCSVDRLVGADGILEIKCPLAPRHLETLIFGWDRAHWIQCQGQLWITGRKWVDMLSFFPELPPAMARMERNEDTIELLSKAVEEFCDRLEHEERKLRAVQGEVAA